jgi:hypothetical protein
MTLQIGTTFPNISSAKEAIKFYVSNASESWKTAYSDKTRFDIVCRTLRSCKFRIRASDSKKKGVHITHLKLHTCSPASHFGASNMNSLEYIIPHHRAAVVDNPKITPKQIQSIERLQYYNKIPYLQAYRAKQAILEELYGDETQSFALLPAYIEKFKAVDSNNYAVLETQANGVFQAAFFAPAPCRSATKRLRQFYAIDGTHTKSRYRMILLICCGIDANDKVTPLAWALVPIEEYH